VGYVLYSAEKLIKGKVEVGDKVCLYASIQASRTLSQTKPTNGRYLEIFFGGRSTIFLKRYFPSNKSIF
jgi:hypothetical protein